MARTIKGLKIEISGDTTGLNSALRKSNEELKTTQSRLNEVNKALKMDPKNAELMAVKQRELAKAVKTTGEMYKAAKDAAAEAKKQFEAGAITREKYDEYIVTLANLKGKFEQAKAEASKLNQTLSSVGTAAGKVADATRGISTVAAAAVGSLVTMGVKAAHTADDLMTLSQQTGVSTDELQKMQYAADLVDVSVDDMVNAMARLTRSMASSSGETQAAFSRLGVSVTDAGGQMRNNQDVFYDVLQALSNIGNETERDQLAMQIFGKSANELAGIIDDGGEALKAYGEEAANLGLIMDEQTLQSLNKVNDEFDRLKNLAKMEFAQAGAAALEAMTPVIEDLIGMVSSLLQWFGSLDTDSMALILTLGLLVASISPVAFAINQVTMAAQTLIPVISKAIATLTTMQATTAALYGIVGLFAGVVIALMAAWDDMNGIEKAIGILGALVTAAAAAAIATGALSSAATMGVAAAGIAAGIGTIALAVNAATRQKDTTSAGITSGIMAQSAGGYGGGPSYNTYNNYMNTTNNYGSKQPQPIQVNIDGHQAAMAMYDPLQDVGYAHGPNWTR